MARQFGAPQFMAQYDTTFEIKAWPGMARGHLEPLRPTARFLLREYFIPGCDGRGPGAQLDLRVRHAAWVAVLKDSKNQVLGN